MTQPDLFGELPVAPVPRTLLISILQKWHESIVLGRKRFEYRRAFLNEPTRAVVYVSGPGGALRGYAEFGQPTRGRPSEIAAIGDSEEPGLGDRLLAYFGDRTNVFAVPIDRYVELPPIRLGELRSELGTFHPPQSYVFLDRQPALKALLKARAGWGELL